MSERSRSSPPPQTQYEYPPPVSRLLRLGDVRALGLTAEQVPALIRMAVDEELQWADSDSPEVWAPVHAWRALAQLQAGPAAKPLASLQL